MPGRRGPDRTPPWRAPLLGRAAAIEVSDAPPPRSWVNYALLVASWTAAPILLWTNGFTVPETSANVPLNREWVEVVRRQWEPVENPPQARRFIPQETAAAPNAPFVRLPASLMQAWAEPAWEAQSSKHTPQEFVSAAERPAYSRAWLTGTLEQWTPEGWSAQQPRKLVQDGVAQADSPIPGYRPWLKTALDSWAQPPVLIWQNGVLAASGVDQVATDRQWLDTVLRAWEPVADDVQRRARVVESGAVDNPPFGLKPWLPAVNLSWQQSWEAQTTRHLVQPAAPAEKTPYRRAWMQVLQAWEQQLVPLWGGFGVQPETLEPRSRQWLYTVARAWEVTWDAQRARRFLQPGPQIDAPPVTERAWLGKVIEAWEVAPHPAQGWRHLVQPTIVAPDVPPFGLKPWIATTVLAWQQDWAAQTARHLVQPSVPEEKTPYGRGWWLAVQGWSEPSWPAQTSRHLVQAQADAPPVNERAWLAQISLTWEPVPYQPQAARHLAQGRPSDLPPFGLRSWQAALTQWEPASWPAQGWAWAVQAWISPQGLTTMSDRHRTPTTMVDRHRSPTSLSDMNRTSTDMDDSA